MDLSAWLLRRTPPRPLVVAAPGGTAARLAVERVVRTRGWRTAMSPAEANMLVVAGPPTPVLEPHLQRVWAAVPAPRARVDVTDPEEAPHLLDAAVNVLHDAGHQREQAARPAAEPTQHAEHDSRSQHHDMAPTSAHDHHGHHMGGTDMPGGIPMADRADDRDGLKLDQLHLPLGPVLPLWPAGLVVHTRLQGDVIQSATVEVLAADRDSFWDTTRHTARHLDSSARLLDLAGWPDAAAHARRLRDDALDGTHSPTQVQAWAKRIRRSRTLRWLLAGVGTTPLHGDALTRLHRWLDAAENTPEPDRTQWTVVALPTLLDGIELGTARLVVASLDLDLTGTHHA